jgi:hypothetical protein
MIKGEDTTGQEEIELKKQETQLVNRTVNMAN